MKALCTAPLVGVEVGRTYTVVSMTVWPGGSYLSVIDGAHPAVYPGSGFEIVDGRLPGSWTAKMEGVGRLTLEPSAWDIPDFWVRFFDGDPLAVALYVAELPLLDGDHPREDHDLMTWLFAEAPAMEHLSWQRLFEVLDDAATSDPAAAAALLALTESERTTFPLRLVGADLLHARLFLWITDHGAQDLTMTQQRLLDHIRWKAGPRLRIALLAEDGASQATAIFLAESEPQVLGACQLAVTR